MGSRIFALMVLFLSPLGAGAADSCSVSPELGKSAVAFMKANRMILPGEEGPQFGSPNIRGAWILEEAQMYGGVCLLKMVNCVLAYGDKMCTGGYEVLGYQNGKLQLFEKSFALPPSVKVAIGMGVTTDARNRLINENSYYFVELTGASAIAAWKTIVMKILHPGLTAKISATNVRTVNGRLLGTPDGAVSFDRTPNRTWKLKDAVWNLRRGSTPEIEDVYPSQLDGDFGEYFLGSLGVVQPWNAFIILYFDPAQNVWRETGIRELAAKNLRENKAGPMIPAWR